MASFGEFETLTPPEENEVEKHENLETISLEYVKNVLSFALISGNFSWKMQRSKKVTLINVDECRNKVTLSNIVNIWKGLNHFEWEYLLSGWFVLQVKQALAENKSEADISMLFNRDLLTGDHRRVMKRKKVKKFLLKFFDIVFETETELKLRFSIEKLENLKK